MLAVIAFVAFWTTVALAGQLLTRNKYLIATGLLTSVACFILFYSYYVVGMHPILSWLDTWYFVSVGAGVSITITAILAGFEMMRQSDRSSSGSFGGGLLSTFVFGIILVIVFGIGWVGSDPQDYIPWCDDSQVKELAKYASIKFEASESPDTDANQLIQLTPDLALGRVKNNIQDVSSYLTPDSVQIQSIQGHPYAIVSMKPTNWAAFNKNGGVVPGYFRLDALDIYAQPERMFGHTMKIVPGGLGLGTLGFQYIVDNDLDRYVYNNVLEPRGLQALDLQTLEIDDNWQPKYTALLYKRAMGTFGTIPDSYLILDPETGKFDIYPIGRNVSADGTVTYNTSAVPTWVDNIFPMEMFNDYINWWGKYSKHDICQNQGNADQYQVDNKADVFTATGRQYEFKMTSFNDDAAVTHVLYADPRTGEVTGYLATGDRHTPTFETIIKQVKGRTAKLNVDQNVEEAQIQWILGRRVFYAVVTDTTLSSEGYETRAFNSFVFAQISLADQPQNYIIATSIKDAYDQLRRQIARGLTGNTTIDSAAKPIQISGTIERLGSFPKSSFNGSSVVVIGRITFSLISDSLPAQRYFFVADSDEYTSLLQPGEHVIITALNINSTSINEVQAVSSQYIDAMRQQTGLQSEVTPAPAG